MLLRKVKIKNFRSLQDVEISLNKNTILIGENNSGKTAFLDALRIGFGKINRKSSPFEEYDYFVEDSNTDPKESEGIFLEFTFQETIPNEWSEKIVQTLGDIVQLEPYDNNPEEAINSITLRVVSKFDESINDYKIEADFLNLSGQELPQATSRKVYDLQQLSPIFYMQALRDIDVFFSPNSLFWGRFLRRLNIPSERFQDIQNLLIQVNKELISSDANLDQVVKHLENTSKVLSSDKQDMVSIHALPLKTWDVLSKSQVVMKGRGSEVTFPLEKHGQGTQSLASLFLFQAYIEVMMKSSLTEESEAILALEEPEAHLHPQASRSLSKKISEIDCQKIISTHSPYIIQDANLFDLRIFRKKDNVTRIFHLINELKISLEILPSLEKFCDTKNKFNLNINTKTLTIREPINSHEEKGLIGMYRGKDDQEVVNQFIKDSQMIVTEEEEIKLYTFVQRIRGELFFARGWLLAEGQTEYIILTYFAELLKRNLDDHGISIIDYQNNGSPGTFIKIAKLLDYPWMLLSDNDEQGTSTLSQIEKLGYDKKVIDEKVKFLPYVDFETYLAHEGFLEEYTSIAEQKNDYVVKKDQKGNVDKIDLANQIKKDKIGNAKSLVSLLKQKKCDSERVPELIRDLIERCINDAN